MRGKRGLEIGGPTPWLRESTFYQTPARFDNAHVTAPIGAPFVSGILGATHRGDAVSLPFREECFDFVFCCHQLQRLRNPLKALTEMHRVLRPKGGCLIGLTPNRLWTFDHKRPVTPFAELKAHFDKDESELTIMDHVTDDLVNFQYDFSRDPGAGTPAQFISRCKNHFFNRAFHVHVFDFNLIRQCLGATGFTLTTVQLSGLNQVWIAHKQ